jgi:hypothetical protein
MSDSQNEDEYYQLRTGIDEIVRTNEQVTSVLGDLQLKQSNLTEMYSSLVQQNQSRLYLFGLDSLQFQSQMIKIEHDNLKRFHKIIRNRLYGDFFKLYHIVKSFMKDNPKLINLIESRQWYKYPQYKDLQVETSFNIAYVKRIFEDIIIMIKLLNTHVNKLDHQLDLHTRQMSDGLNINNFVSTFESCNNEIRNKITLYLKYIKYLIKTHKHYLLRFYKRALILNGHFGEGLRFQTIGDCPIDLDTNEETPGVSCNIGKRSNTKDPNQSDINNDTGDADIDSKTGDADTVESEQDNN